MLFDNNGTDTSAGEFELTTESYALIMGAAIAESLSMDELKTFLESSTEVSAAIQEEVVLEKTIVRLDKIAKLTRAQKMAAFALAKQHNDPKFKKLVTVWRIERSLEEQILRKYFNDSLRMARKSVANASKSKSTMVKKVANSVKQQLHAA